MARQYLKPQVARSPFHISILAAIEHLNTEYGMPPTLREVSYEIQCWRSTLYYHVGDMARIGLVHYVAKSRRSLMLTGEGRAVLAKAKEATNGRIR